MSGRLGGPCDKCHQSHPGKDCEEYAAERDAAINEIVKSAMPMKPIDQLVSLGIVRESQFEIGFYYIVGFHVELTEDQVLSNNDVMAAVMDRLDEIKIFNLLASKRVWRVCAWVNNGRREFNCVKDHENQKTAIILTGLQALEGE